MCIIFSESKGEKYQTKTILFVLIKSRMSEHYLHAKRPGLSPKDQV